VDLLQAVSLRQLHRSREMCAYDDNCAELWQNGSCSDAHLRPARIGLIKEHNEPDGIQPFFTLGLGIRTITALIPSCIDLLVI